MSTSNLPGGKGRPARGADNLTAICEPIVYKMWDPRRLTTLWAFTTCYTAIFTFFYLIFIYGLNLKVKRLKMALTLYERVEIVLGDS
jgi:hypothetical protein